MCAEAQENRRAVPAFQAACFGETAHVYLPPSNSVDNEHAELVARVADEESAELAEEAGQS